MTPSRDEPAGSEEQRSSLRALAQQRESERLSQMEELRRLKDSVPALMESLTGLAQELEQKLEAATARVDETLERLEKSSIATARQISNQLESTAASVRAEATTLDRGIRSLRWRVWSLHAAVAILVPVLLVLGLSSLRPGWSLTEEQRNWMRFGEEVSERYENMTPDGRRSFDQWLSGR